MRSGLSLGAAGSTTSTVSDTAKSAMASSNVDALTTTGPLNAVLPCALVAKLLARGEAPHDQDAEGPARALAADHGLAEAHAKVRDPSPFLFVSVRHLRELSSVGRRPHRPRLSRSPSSPKYGRSVVTP